MDKEYQEYFTDSRVRNAIGVLSELKGIVSNTTVREALDAAVDSLKYLRAEVYNDREYLRGLEKTADCVVTDHGPRGYYYRCSYCGEGRWSNDLNLERRGCYCGRVLDNAKLETLDRELISSSDKLTLVKDLLSSIDNGELRRLANEYNNSPS